MSNSTDVKYIVYKRMVYVVKVGPLYLWKTASATKSECILKGLEVLKVKTENALKYKGAEIIRLFVKEIKAQET
jgi:hypothetical protein